MTVAATDDDFLALTTTQLLRQCSWSTFRGPGPGGQKRNKTASAVRLRHHPTGLSSTATESRNQSLNRRRAIERLRWRIAMTVRRAITLAEYRPSAALQTLLAKTGAVDWPRAMQEVIDLLVAHDLVLHQTARVLGTRTAQLSLLLAKNARVLEMVNGLRRQRGLRPLREPKR